MRRIINSETYEKHTLPLDRLLCLLPISLIIVTVVLGTLSNCNNNVSDKNVYLNEEVCFAKDVFFKVDKINVTENISTTYNAPLMLNLGVVIEKRSENKSSLEIKPKLFLIKQSNKNGSGPMFVFFKSLFNSTVSYLLDGFVEGSINLIDETINFASEYITSSIEDASTENSKLPSIKCISENFNIFIIDNENKCASIKISFPISDEYLEGMNSLVLSIDTWNHIEKNIFLVKRPINQ